MTWVTRISKFEDANEMKDYRPISMVGNIYKVITKILENRMEVVMPKLISETQSAFVGGRQILDGALVASEVVRWLKKKKALAALIKLNFHKAYDRVRW